MKSLILISLFALAGCQSMSNHLTPQEESKIVSLARNAVVASEVLSADEVQKISLSRPVLAYYFLARPHADYSLRWKLTDTEEIVVSGRGDILRLENAAVTRRAIKSPQPTTFIPPKSPMLSPLHMAQSFTRDGIPARGRRLS